MNETIGKSSPDTLHSVPLGTSQSATTRTAQPSTTTTNQPNFNSNSCSYAGGGQEIDDASHSSEPDLAAAQRDASTSGYESPVRVKTGSEPPADAASVGAGVHVLPLVQTIGPQEELRNSIRGGAPPAPEETPRNAIRAPNVPLITAASNEPSTKNASIPDTRVAGGSVAGAAHEHGKHSADDSSSLTTVQQQQQQRKADPASTSNQNLVQHEVPA